MHKIEKGIPVGPEKRGRPQTMLFREMEVGDSYLSESRYFGNSAAAWGWMQKPPRRFTTQKVEDGYRTWRIK